MSAVRTIAGLPDVILRSDGPPTTRRPRFVATGYGGSVRSSFSGTSAFLAEAGIATGDLDGAFTLYSDAAPDRLLQTRGALWKVRQRVRGESSSGFKFSGRFSAHLWDKHLPALRGADLVNNFQLYSPRFFRERHDLDIGAYFYLDGTLHDYLRGYREFDVAAIDPATTDRAMRLERAGYEQADGLMVMCAATARTLETEYGVPSERIDVVLPGANLDDATAEEVVTARRTRPAGEMVNVGFVGVYPERKGLPKLAAAVAALRAEGVAVRLTVIGRCPDDIAEMDGVDALGVIDKRSEPHRFAQALAGIDLGAQLSTVELFGIAVLEYLRCGIPFLATEVGGIVDILHQGGGIGVPAAVSVDEVASRIRRFVQDETHRAELVTQAQARQDQVRWTHTARRIGEVLARRR